MTAGPPDDEDEPRSAGRVGTTRPGTLVGLALLGLVTGWLARTVAIALDGTAPAIGWVPVLALLFVAAVVGAVAWSTHRTLHRRHERLPPQQAVNRLVLGKACALVGALVAGAYLGYALSWLGLTESELARQRVARSLAGGGSGIALVVASLLLERACRVRRDRG